ncbi:MAG TPA: nucleoside-diphosphate kinase [Armatimonadetes bacterium]|nr:nucleoside-diphosphate kinase [Armatimonadota bacterium]
MDRTLAIIKPDAVAAGNTGAILAAIEAAGFRLAALRRRTFSRAEAETFYAVHAEKSFFGQLIDFMVSGPCVVAVLEREGAVEAWREALLPIREQYGSGVTANAVHGSDADETAAVEIAFLFSGAEID